MPYETIPRKQPTALEAPDEVKRLPIKLANGKIQETGTKSIASRPPPSEKDSDDDSESEPEEMSRKVEDVSTGARFGRPAVVDVLQTKSRKHRVEMAKEQIAGICQDILADPENGVSLGFPNPRFPCPLKPTIANSLVFSDDCTLFLSKLSQLRRNPNPFPTTHSFVNFRFYLSWPFSRI
jgi:hypothetical protein